MIVASMKVISPLLRPICLTILGLLHKLLVKILSHRRDIIFSEYNRVVSVGDYIFSRSEKAAYYGFGQGTTVYDNVLILGDVLVGSNCWIGPNTILDGSGGLLTIGDNTYISAGVQIYTHLNMPNITLSTVSLKPSTVTIGSNCYLGPSSIVTMGSVMDDGSTLGALSMLNGLHIPQNSIAYGIPAQVINHHS